MDWMLMPLRRYAEFGGRSRRKEYWMFALFTVIVSALLSVLDNALGLKVTQDESRIGSSGVLGSLFSLAILVPSIAVGVRRLHDSDRSGWWLLVPVAVFVLSLIAAFFTADRLGFYESLLFVMVPVAIGGIVLLVLFCLPGTVGANRYGADPKGAGSRGADPKGDGPGDAFA